MRLDSTDTGSFKPGLLCLAITCALAMTQAQAVGMGTIEVKSKLNEPFVAEIPLDVDYNGQMDDMVVHLASPEEFERVGLERPHEMSANLTFTVTRNARGEPIVRVTTPQRMSDPYVSFLLEAEWGNGKMVREYTALLDPPRTVEVPHGTISAPMVTSTPLPAPVVSPPVVHAIEPEQLQPKPTPPPVVARMPAPAPQAAPVPVVPAPQPSAPQAAAPPAPEPRAVAPEPVASAPQPEPAPTPAAPEPAPQVATPEPPQPVAETPPPPPAEAPAPQPQSIASDSITVGRGQTLSSIAGQMRTPDVSLNRMMIALQRANPDAFVGNNINRLKAGAILRMPDAEQASAVTPDEANVLVHEQVESWRQGTQAAPQLQPGEASGNTASTPAPASSNAAAPNGAPAASKNANANVAGGSASTTVSAGSAHAGRPRGAHLEILPPAGNAAGHSQSGSSEGGSGSELRAELAQSKEELTARKAEITDLKAHVADLEKIKTDSQKLLSMKDSQLAALQQRLAELEKKDSDAAAAQASPASAASTASTAASTTSEVSAAASSAASGAASTAASTSASSTAAASTAAAPPVATTPKKPTPVVHPAPPPPQEPETPWFLQPFVLAGGGLILFAGLLGLMLKRPRAPAPPPRRRSFDIGALAAAPSPRPAVVTEELPGHASGDSASAARPALHGSPEPEPFVPEPAVSAPVIPEKPAPAAFTPIQPPASGGWTAATRLEAARACIESGDTDGARSMLEAALIEGNAAQQEEAFKLLDMLEG